MKKKEKDYDANFYGYRKSNFKEKDYYIKKLLNKLTIQMKLRDFTLRDALKEFDATSWYPSAM